MTENNQYFYFVERFANEREAVAISTLVAAYRAGTLTEDRAMLAVAEIAAVRTFINNLRRELDIN